MTPRVFINSVPKSGTHLVERALQLMHVSTQPPLFLSSADSSWFAPAGDEPSVPVGIGMPMPASTARLRARLSHLPEGQVITGHVPWSAAMADLLQDLGYRMLLATRDPRDIAVSLAHHIATQPAHRLHTRFAAMTPEERITAAICGTDGLQSLHARLAAVRPWTQHPIVLPVRFEDLVGARGGGDDAAQLRAIQSISSHLGISPTDLSLVALNLFGHSPTFRKGLIGQWRTAFSPNHHHLASPLLADNP